ncbi:hypothetical protein [Amphritea balenae]|uniref:PBP domain-containing protein n=1 Tax=Amphritea balenae TaxID=452629 RepID=A0A3P1SXK5_9GAMM|nr:hypothetical protein [Amphritea balenae]RRD01778.1 hypothetical protein EHS89_04330 [Amphritea balenae]
MSLLILVFSLCLNTSSAVADSVIVSMDVEELSFNKNFLLAVFSMRVTRWPDGRPIKVFVLPDRHPVHHRFVKQHLQIFPYQLRNNWDRQVYTGTGEAPVQVDDIDEMYIKVSQTPGSIGYLSAPKELSLKEVRSVDEY